MRTIAVCIVKGAGAALIVAVPLWWLPTLLQQPIPDRWLAGMTFPAMMLGGYVAARRASRPIVAGVLTGVLAMSLVLTVALTTGEYWVAPVLLACGGVSAVLGAYIAVRAGHAPARR